MAKPGPTSFHAVVEALDTVPKSNSLYDQERITQYRTGGYHPTRLGDTFKEGGYRIVPKLGWGGFATVWLVRDEKLEKWASLKICEARAETAPREVSVLEALKHCGASEYILDVFDVFMHGGPNGSHVCIVTELLGPSVHYVLTDYGHGGDKLDREIIIRVATQILQGIARFTRLDMLMVVSKLKSRNQQNNVNAVLGRVDVSCANVCFTASNLANPSEDALLDVIGTPASAIVVRKDGSTLESNLPSEVVRSASWKEWADELEEDIRLIDWGEAFPLGEAPSGLAQPLDLSAPETIFADQFDHRIDLWRAGCVIYALVFGIYPFSFILKQSDLIGQMIEFVGRLPSEWEEKAQDLMKDSKRAFPSPDQTLPRLDSRFSESAVHPDLLGLQPIIKGLMRFLPSDRLTACEALELLPEYEYSADSEDDEDSEDGQEL
ncbi:kinase-like protein [Dissoconium aciculare CBS 342.82]|uniref:non-specific serine/threonine protein kinase n=1 Tax=Dissoconium aciculare CBS 342.82 TaxID=1314786 RepID=A0A6J3M3M7_9PEZI|nr:kinase-like protein [Dissoconium aciculare CBS 342.82]KAF1821532.1 kinase-like protein [Dissoconium aciculare CBS 342.82]